MTSTSQTPQSLGFFYGIRALFRGIGLFWTHPRWWVWALLPSIAILFLTIAVWQGLFHLFHDCFEIRLFLSQGLAYVITLGGLYLFFPVLYETLGGLFFDGLTARVYRDILQKKFEPRPFWSSCQYTAQALWYSCCTLLMAIPLVFVLIIPWVGILIWSIIFGYRFGVSYLFSGGLMRGETVKETCLWARTHRKVLAGFGISAYLIISFLPLIGLLFVPCFVVAAVCIREESSSSASRFCSSQTNKALPQKEMEKIADA